jgi:hypothetical protein
VDSDNYLWHNNIQRPSIQPFIQQLVIRGNCRIEGACLMYMVCVLFPRWLLLVKFIDTAFQTHQAHQNWAAAYQSQDLSPVEILIWLWFAQLHARPMYLALWQVGNNFTSGSMEPMIMVSMHLNRWPCSIISLGALNTLHGNKWAGKNECMAWQVVDLYLGSRTLGLEQAWHGNNLPAIQNVPQTLLWAIISHLTFINQGCLTFTCNFVPSISS